MIPAGPRSVCGSIGVYCVSLLQLFFVPYKMLVDNNYMRDTEKFLEDFIVGPRS
jgi:hypothetical protein